VRVRDSVIGRFSHCPAARTPRLGRAALPCKGARGDRDEHPVPGLFPKPEGTKAQHTALSFRVDEIATAVAELSGRGVQFADYDLPGLKTTDHVCVLGSEKAAWFEDPEGNILCLHQDL
jgi:hypothetical protein